MQEIFGYVLISSVSFALIGWGIKQLTTCRMIIHGIAMDQRREDRADKMEEQCKFI